MTPDELKRQFPNASAAFIQLNATVPSSGTAIKTSAVMTLACRQCGTEFTAFPSDKRKYCSLSCAYASLERTKRENSWTAEQEQKLREFYLGDDLDLNLIAAKLGKSHAAIAGKASKLKISFQRGKAPKSLRAKNTMSEKRKGRKPCPAAFLALQSIPHPKGMLGKHHTDATKKAISVANTGKLRNRSSVISGMKTKLSKYGRLFPALRRGSWKASWVEIGGQRFYARSRWEANYARFLQWRLQQGEVSEWKHEPETFWFEGIKRGCVSYLPDFRVVFWSGEIEYHEVKGWMDAASKTKIKRMDKYHPDIKLVVIDKDRYIALARTCKRIVPGWE